jgi:uncharacterized protein
MIRASVVLDADAALRSFKASGHAEAGDSGYDLVCAAFTILARTAYRALEAQPGIAMKGRATEPGSLSFDVVAKATSAERAAGVADFLVVGIGDLAREYPGKVELAVKRDWRE